MIFAVCWVLSQPGQGSNSGGSGSSSSCSDVGCTCDMCGGTTTYSEQLLTGTLDGVQVTKRTITANGCPNHYSVWYELRRNRLASCAQRLI